MEFTLRERDRRYKAVRSNMEKVGLDALIVYGITGLSGQWKGNFVYLTNRCLLSADGLMFFPLDRDPTIFVSGDNQYLEAKRGQWVHDIRMTRQPVADLCALISSHKSARGKIGVSSFAGLPVRIADQLRSQLPGAEFVDALELILAVREIKSDEELLVARRGAEVADAGVRHLLEVLRPGATEFKWKAELESVMTACGADGGFNTIAAGRAEGEHDAFRGFVVAPTERKFAKGDLVLMEISPRVNGYYNQLVRLISFGEPPEYIRKAHAACVAAKHSALDKLKPGETLANVAKAVQEKLLEHGYATRGIQAHTLGLDLSESIITPENQKKVEQGFLVTVHPMVATGDWRQLFVGETYFVHKDGVEALNKIDEAILVVD